VFNTYSTFSAAVYVSKRIMVLKFFETLDSLAKYIEKEENEKGVKYVRRSVCKSFGSDSELILSNVLGTTGVSLCSVQYCS